MDELSTIKILDQAIRSEIVKSSIPLREAAHRASMPSSQFLRWWSSEDTLLSQEQAESFLSSYGESIPSFVHKEFALSLATDHLYSPSILPEVYGKNPLSFVSSSRHILSMIELKYGKLVVHNLLSHLQVPFHYFENLQNRIGIKFFEDLLAEYIRFGNSKKEFTALSRALFITIEDNILQSAFPRAKSYEEAFNTVQNSTKYFDENFDYHFSVSSQSAEIRCRPSEALAASVKNDRYPVGRRQFSWHLLPPARYRSNV
jgi:hypothetical protein